jgi:uncharacterized membrane protein
MPSEGGPFGVGPIGAGPSGPGTPTRRRVIWLAVGLFASVLLNLFLAGVVTGRLAGAGPVGEMFAPASAPEMSSGWERILERFRALPVADRLRFRAAMGAHRDTLRPAAAALVRARMHVLTVLAAPTYDKQAMEDALAAVRQATTAAQVAMHDALVEALGRLSPAARARLGSPLRDDGG